MISIIGDTVDELADLQLIIETGLLNSNENSTLNNITYRLFSGDILLVDQYYHIVGKRERE